MIDLRLVILENEMLKADNKELRRQNAKLSGELLYCKREIIIANKARDGCKGIIEHQNSELWWLRQFANSIACKVAPAYSQILSARHETPVNASDAINRWVTLSDDQCCLILAAPIDDIEDTELMAVKFECNSFMGLAQISRNELVWIIQ